MTNSAGIKSMKLWIAENRDSVLTVLLYGGASLLLGIACAHDLTSSLYVNSISTGGSFTAPNAGD